MFNTQFFKVVYNIKTVFLIAFYFSFVSASCCGVVGRGVMLSALLFCAGCGGVLTVLSVFLSDMCAHVSVAHNQN